MKVGIVIRARWFRASIDMEGYAAAIRRRGDEPVLFCLGSDVPDPDVEVVEATPEGMQDPEFWKLHGLDVAIVFCWLRGSRMVGALRRAGVRTVLRADSDGCVSVRVFPREAWMATVSPAVSPLDRLRRMKHWLHRFLALSRGEDAELAATIESSDAVAIEFPRARENLLRVLRHAGRSDLAAKVHIVSHSLRDDFLAIPPDLSRPATPTVLSLARWEDPQKDATLCARVVHHIVQSDPSVRFTLIGSAASGKFRAFEGHSQVTVHDRIDPSRIPEILSGHSVLFSSSRWEGQSIIGMEALCFGLTLVAPPVPCFQDLVAGGACGATAPDRSVSSLAKALLSEVSAWKSGSRSRSRVAGTLRSEVTNDAVVGRLLEVSANPQARRGAQ